MKIVKIPFDNGGLSKGKGSRDAPNEIIRQLENNYANEDGEQKTQEIIEIPTDTSDSAHKKIEEHASEDSIFLGGDHSITYSLFKGLKKKFETLKLIVFDAHPDLMKDFEIPTHESYLRELLDKKIVQPDDVILLGIRNWDATEKAFLEENKIKFIPMKDIFADTIQTTTEKLFKNEPVYLSIDIDVVDPVEAIGTGYIEHGGMSSRQLIHFIQHIKKTNSIIGADIVEVNPSKDVNNITSALAAKLIKELL